MAPVEVACGQTHLETRPLSFTKADKDRIVQSFPEKIAVSVPGFGAQELPQRIFSRHPRDHDQQNHEKRKACAHKDQQVANDLPDEVQDVHIASSANARLVPRRPGQLRRVPRSGQGHHGAGLPPRYRRYRVLSIKACAAAGLETLWPLMTYR